MKKSMSMQTLPMPGRAAISARTISAMLSIRFTMRSSLNTRSAPSPVVGMPDMSSIATGHHCLAQVDRRARVRVWGRRWRGGKHLEWCPGHQRTPPECPRCSSRFGSTSWRPPRTRSRTPPARTVAAVEDTAVSRKPPRAAPSWMSRDAQWFGARAAAGRESAHREYWLCSPHEPRAPRRAIKRVVECQDHPV